MACIWLKLGRIHGERVPAKARKGGIKTFTQRSKIWAGMSALRGLLVSLPDRVVCFPETIDVLGLETVVITLC